MSASMSEKRPVALCPICSFEDIEAAEGEPVPAVCARCAAEAAEWENF